MADNRDWEEGKLSFLDTLTILSFVIGVENLSLNQKQVDSLEQHLKSQDDDLLSKIIAQNEELIDLDKEIIKLLKELKNAY